MAEIPDSLQTLFTGKIKELDGKYVIGVPETEIKNNTLDPSTPQRVAILGHNSAGESDHQKPGQQNSESDQTDHQDGPPVTKGERRTVTVNNIGDQGDGIARVEHGYVVIVPDTKPEDIVEVEIENVQENVAFADVIEHKGTTTNQT